MPCASRMAPARELTVPGIRLLGEPGEVVVKLAPVEDWASTR